MTVIDQTEAVAQLVRDVVVEARAARRADLADPLEASVATRPASPTVVVVGEQKAGKSSLVNALLGPEGSPTAAEVATSCYLEFGHADAPGAGVFTAGRAEPIEIAVADVRDWATVDGPFSLGYAVGDAIRRRTWSCAAWTSATSWPRRYGSMSHAGPRRSSRR